MNTFGIKDNLIYTKLLKYFVFPRTLNLAYLFIKEEWTRKKIHK